MAGLKEIRRRLKSVKNTQKITYAMKLVSAAKLRKAQEAVTSSREYTNALNDMLAQLTAEGSAETLSHPLLEARPAVRKVAILVIGGQRGLCGGYNTNVNRRVDALMRELNQKHPGAQITSYILGKKPADFYRRKGYSYQQSWEELSENASQWPIAELGKSLEQGFREENFDEVWMVFTRFKSAISQTAMAEKLLPLDPNISQNAATAVVNTAPILFEPSPQAVFSALLPRILNCKILLAALDAKASETANRMTAMDAATKNAKQLGRKLELAHNKLRQMRITSELLDILGGAEATK